MSMDDRAKSFENKYAHDQQKLFRIEARTSKLVGLWAAEQMGLSAEAAEAYAKEVIASNMDEPGFDDIKRKVMGDFGNRDMDISEHTVETVIEKKFEEAAAQIEAEAK